VRGRRACEEGGASGERRQGATSVASVSSSGRELVVTATSPPRPPRKAFEHPGRFAIVALGLMAVLSLLVAAVLSADTDTPDERDPLPAEVLSVFPEPDTLSRPQQGISVTLRPGLTGVIQVDGIEIPEDQLTRPSESSMSFQPGPDREFGRFETGPHTVTIVYWPTIRTREEAADTFSYGFRTTA